MRSGGCAVQQQALAAEAAAVVRQAVALARRRGHAQVTPLHVASALLSAAAGLLRAACLRSQSHSHPLQCKALELCLNVALNRLPATAFHSGFGGSGRHASSPVLSNALIAAFKRAQAHQRRGAVEGQQPGQLAAKVDLDQLVVSILDDPSVSRVMREAGFSSSQVKANVEKAVSISSPPAHHHHTSHSNTPASCHARSRRVNNGKVVVDDDDDDDAMRVLDCMTGGRTRCAVIVGESAAAAEGVVKAVMDRVSKGELQRRHERLKNLQFLPLSAASFQRMTREEVDAMAGDLRALARQGSAAGKGVVLVLEDLAYAAEAWNAASERRKRENCYCPIEHGVMEVSSLVSPAAAGRGLDSVWLLGFGNNQAYMKCRAGQPSLEALWELHPVVVPDGGAALSLSCTRSEAQQQDSHEGSRTGWPMVNGAAADGSDLIALGDAVTVTPNLPQWLRGHQDSDQNGPERCTTSSQLQEWSRNCHASSAQPTSELTLSFSSLPTTTSPSPSSTSDFANNTNTNIMMTCKPCQLAPIQPWLNHRYDDPMANSYDHQTLHADPSPESYSVSNSSESGAVAVQPKFTELTAEKLKILCSTLENRVPHHKDMVADIASAVLQCRSGMARTRWHREKPNMATWLFFHGMDIDGKKAVAQELARLVFGSYTNFTSISLSCYTTLRSKSSSGEIVLKRQRSLDHSSEHGYVQSFYNTILENPHQVIMIDGADQLDFESNTTIRGAITNGRIMSCNGDEASLEDVIVILSCDTLDSRSTGSSPRLKQRAISNEGDEGNVMNTEKGVEPSCFIFDLNACVEDEQEGDGGSASDILNFVDGVFLFQTKEGL